MIRALRRWARRVGLLSYKPYVCGACGYSVPQVGERRAQAMVAYYHWAANHDSAGSTE